MALPGFSRERECGFSLIEVLVALMIFTLGATSIIALFAAASASHKRSIDRTRASMLAEEIIAQVQARYYPGTEPGELVSSLVESIPEIIDGYRWDVMLIKPGQEALEAANRLGRSPGGTTKTAATGNLKKSRGEEQKRKTRKRTTAVKGKKMVPSGAQPQENRAWMVEELIVRVTVGWSQSGRLMLEHFDTIILPRPIPSWMEDSRKRL